MLKSLKDLFDALRPAERAASGATPEHLLQLATAVLLVEVMRADTAFEPAERRAVVQALHARFALADDEMQRLVELAEHTAHGATDYYTYTSRINAIPA